MPLFGTLAGQEATITPNDIPSLQLWYDASVASATNFNPVPTNGGVVTAWVDKLGNGRDANQATANRKPLWRASQQNGLGTIQFDGTNDVLTLNPIAWALSLPGQTTYIVFKLAATTDQMHLTSSNTNGFAFFNNGGFWAAETAGGLATSDAAVTTTGYHYIGQILDGTQTNANITTQNNLRLRVRLDGVQRTLTFGTNVGTATSGSANTLNVGADDSGSANFLNGYLGEMMIWTRTLNATEISQVETYLANKWGI
jgi:hypothetical protein